MTNTNRRHVVPNNSGGWDIKAPGAKRISGSAPTQRQAQERAKEEVAA